MDPYNAPDVQEFTAPVAETPDIGVWTVVSGIFAFLRMHIVNIVLCLPFAVAIWWKTVIRSQASTIVSSKDRKPAPATPVTLASLSRKALTIPAQLLQNAKDLGAYYITYVMGAPLVITSDPDIARIIFTDRLKCHRRAYNTVDAGVLILDDDVHARVHKVLATALSDPMAISSLMAVIQRRIRSETIPELDEACRLGERVDLVPIFEELVADSFAIWSIWDEAGSESKTELEILVDARRTLADLKFVLPTGAIWFFDTLRDRIPLMEYLAFLPGCKDYYIRTHQKRRARKLVNDLLLAAKKRREDGDKKIAGERASLFHRLMETEALPFEEVVDNLEVIQRLAEIHLFAAIPNLLYLLSHDKPTQTKIQGELTKLRSSTVDPADVAKLPTLDLATKESFRILPPMPITYNRVSTKTAFKLPGMWVLPEGFHIAVDLLSLQRSTAVFGDDADSFIPDRFRPEVGLDVADSTLFGHSFKPFGGGAFACPGQKLATQVVKVIVAEVLKRYEVLPFDGVAAAGIEGYKCSQGGSLRSIAGSPVVLKKK